MAHTGLDGTRAERRACRARSIERIEQVLQCYEEPEEDYTIGDLLADLRTYCRKYRIDFEAALNMSEIHFEAEKD